MIHSSGVDFMHYNIIMFGIAMWHAMWQALEANVFDALPENPRFLYQTSSSPCKDCHDMGYTWLYHGENQPIFGGTHGLSESDGTLENPQALLSIAPRR